MPSELLPTGTVTLLFTDIEGSTRMLQELGREAYVRALEAHRRLLREAFTSRGGVEVEMQGDSFFFAFPYARDAIAAAVAAQQSLAEHAWESQPIKVRIGLHTGEPMQADGLYAGLDVHWAARVMSAGHGGQVLLSARTAELVANELNGVELRDLGAYRLKDLTAPQPLYQVGDEEFPPLKTLAPQSKLPVAASPLIGRELKLASLRALLRSDARLVTITGTGGTGKTRLALQAAADLVDDFRDGVFWVPLAGLRDPDLVLASVAQVLDARVELAAHLRDSQLLLVLDNFEHLMVAAPELAHLQAQAPGVTALVTSRAPLHVTGENEFPLDQLAAADAVTLFLERARAAGRPLAPDEHVVEICRRLDNLPLALELAATRTKLLTPSALLGRLDQRLPLLTGGRRDAPLHQQTLTATIGWSIDLLDVEATRLVPRLSVFAGTFSVEAAEDICGAQLDTLGALVDLSLLKPVAGRLLMLETIREFAGNALEATGETAALRGRHAEWYLDLANEAAKWMYGAQEADWFERLDADQDNIRAALETLFDGDEPTRILQLVAALGRFWVIRGFFAEGLAWTERALALGTPPSAERAAVLEAAEGFARAVQDFECASGFARERLEYAQEVGDTPAVASALAVIALDAQFQGDFAAARELLGEAMTAVRTTDDRAAIGLVLNELGFLALAEKDYVRATARFDEAAALARERGDEQTMAAAAGNLGMVLIEQGRGSEAVLPIEESLLRSRKLGDSLGLAGAIDQAGMLAVLNGDPSAGAILMGAAAAMWEELGTDIDFAFRQLRDGILAASRTALGDAPFEQVWKQGRALPREQAFSSAERSLSGLRPLDDDGSVRLGTL